MANQVSVEVVGGSAVTVAWTQGMNAQQTLELAWAAINNTQTFTYGLQYLRTAARLYGLHDRRDFRLISFRRAAVLLLAFLCQRPARKRGHRQHNPAGWRGLAVQEENEFDPPAGSKLVASVMNDIKRTYRFIDLLKPEKKLRFPSF